MRIVRRTVSEGLRTLDLVNSSLQSNNQVEIETHREVQNRVQNQMSSGWKFIGNPLILHYHCWTNHIIFQNDSDSKGGSEKTRLMTNIVNCGMWFTKNRLGGTNHRDVIEINLLIQQPFAATSLTLSLSFSLIFRKVRWYMGMRGSWERKVSSAQTRVESWRRKWIFTDSSVSLSRGMCLLAWKSSLRLLLWKWGFLFFSRCLAVNHNLPLAESTKVAFRPSY